ncbi:DUF3192 domain-containing protein [Aliikangiella marina]|uniref:DUF3192 domain-containing protein n=1 Tax=Aliikangiella marina TaxID=1712262 RepID=A0A545T533_9GAMM|nr:DUF3192 domain-containing protein [Aliikangiella marina]TQV72278.1 DUF3192 domain-containing protein [Aliikangiella marina]
MKQLLNLAAASLLAVSLSGCIIVDGEYRDWNDSDWKSEQRENRSLISRLELNESRQRVVSRLGAPNFSEAFSRGEDQYRILFYRTHHRHSDGDTTKDETTPLVFKNDTLIGWGHDVLAEVSSYN